MELPAAVADTVADPDVRLVLHVIRFSHYCERARWTLRLLGIPYKEVAYLPMQHIPRIIKLQRTFKCKPGKPTVSSKSPAATPCLAIYAADGQPLCLLQDSCLIGRYAALRAAALPALKAQPALYGPGLRLADASNEKEGGAAGAADGGGACKSVRAVTGGDAAVEELERRMGDIMGVETRRLAYFNLLPATFVGGELFVRNRGGSSKLVAWLLYFACRLLLPRLLKVNAVTAARGKQRLLEEWDRLDSLLEQQEAQQKGSAPGSGGDRLPFYLTGPNLTAADVALACLATPVVNVPNELQETWTPPLEALPAELRAFCEELRQRPTGRFVLRMWEVHGPRATAASKL